MRRVCLTRFVRPDSAFGSLAVNLVALRVAFWVVAVVAVFHLVVHHLAVVVDLVGRLGRLPASLPWFRQYLLLLASLRPALLAPSVFLLAALGCLRNS